MGSSYQSGFIRLFLALGFLSFVGGAYAEWMEPRQSRLQSVAPQRADFGERPEVSEEDQILWLTKKIAQLEGVLAHASKSEKKDSKSGSLRSGGDSGLSKERLEGVREELDAHRAKLSALRDGMSGSDDSGSSGGSQMRGGNSGRCSSSSDCRAAEVCVAGRCTNGDCAKDIPCPGGKVCYASECRECSEDSHCSSGEACEYFKCVPKGNCKDDEHCPCGTYCEKASIIWNDYCKKGCNGSDKCRGKDCEDHELCNISVFGGRACYCLDSRCPDGTCCGRDGQCSRKCECNTAIDCPDGKECDNGECVEGCNTDLDCKGGIDCEICDRGVLGLNSVGKCRRPTRWGKPVQCPVACTNAGSPCNLDNDPNGLIGCCEKNIWGQRNCKASDSCTKCRTDQIQCKGADGTRCCDKKTEYCDNGECKKLCDDGRPYCGNECCDAGDTCEDGQCVEGVSGSQCYADLLCCSTNNMCGKECHCADKCYACAPLE